MNIWLVHYLHDIYVEFILTQTSFIYFIDFFMFNGYDTDKIG
jgi:hypothetical protein